jgi:hypothetical protein
MPSLNRFPLLGLWAREAALRIGHPEADADTIGHAYAVLYAIRANSTPRVVKYKDAEAARAAEEALKQPGDIELLEFGDDELQVTRDPRGRLIGRVGNALPQTPESFRYKVASKFPAGYFDKLQQAFRDFFAAYTSQRLNTRLIYQLYDQWKKACAVGRMVDLDRLLDWCANRKPQTA